MPHVRRNIDINIRNIVRNISDLLLSVLLNYMMKSYSKNHHHNMEIVRYAAYDCLYLLLDGDTMNVVEKLYAADVFMRLDMITLATG